MKSIIKSINRAEKRVHIYFNIDKEILQNIEKAFKKLDSKFLLANYRKYKDQEEISDFYQSIKENKDYEFSLVVKEKEVRLKIKATSDKIDEFMESLMNFVDFAKYDQKNIPETRFSKKRS